MSFEVTPVLQAGGNFVYNSYWLQFYHTTQPQYIGNLSMTLVLLRNLAYAI